jgi:hypothetical protein
MLVNLWEGVEDVMETGDTYWPTLGESEDEGDSFGCLDISGVGTPTVREVLDAVGVAAVEVIELRSCGRSDVSEWSVTDLCWFLPKFWIDDDGDAVPVDLVAVESAFNATLAAA